MDSKICCSDPYCKQWSAIEYCINCGKTCSTCPLHKDDYVLAICPICKYREKEDNLTNNMCPRCNIELYKYRVISKMLINFTDGGLKHETN